MMMMMWYKRSPAISNTNITTNITSVMSLLLGMLLVITTLMMANVVQCRNNKNKKTDIQTELPCTKQAEADVDVVFGRMSGYGNVSRLFPSNQDELNEYCR